MHNCTYIEYKSNNNIEVFTGSISEGEKEQEWPPWRGFPAHPRLYRRCNRRTQNLAGEQQDVIFKDDKMKQDLVENSSIFVVNGQVINVKVQLWV